MISHFYKNNISFVSKMYVEETKCWIQQDRLAFQRSASESNQWRLADLYISTCERWWFIHGREKGEGQGIYDHNFVTAWQETLKRFEKHICNGKMVLSISKPFRAHLFSLYVMLEASTYLWQKWARISGLEAVPSSLEINWFWENTYLYIQRVFLKLFFRVIFITSEDILKDSKSDDETRLLAVLTAINRVVLWQWMWDWRSVDLKYFWRDNLGKRYQKP